MAVKDPTAGDPIEDRANFQGVNPSLLAGYLKAKEELAQQGIHIFTSGQLSGYRTTGQQAGLYANRAKNPNPVARSGYSEHEAGNALDLSVTGGGINDVTHPTVLNVLKKYGLVHNIAGDRPHFAYRGTGGAAGDDQTDAAFQALTGGQPATGGEDQTDAAFQALVGKPAPRATGAPAPVLPKVTPGFGELHRFEAEQAHGRSLKVPPKPGAKPVTIGQPVATAPPTDAAALSRELDRERLFIDQEQRNLKSLRTLIDSGTADDSERLAYNDRVTALSERQSRYQSLYAQYRGLPAGQIPLIRPVQYHPPPEAQTVQQLEQAMRAHGHAPSTRLVVERMSQDLGVAHARLAGTFPTRLQQLETDAQRIQQDDQALVALGKKAKAGQLSPAGITAYNRAIRQHQINAAANEYTRANLLEEAARYDKFVKAHASQPLFPVGQFPEEIAGLGPKPTGPQMAQALVDRMRRYLTPVAGVYEKANLPRAIIAEQLAGRLPPLPSLPTNISQPERERLIREKNDLSQLVDEEQGKRPINPATLTPWQQQLLPILRAQRDAIDRAREIAGVNKGAYIDVGAQTAAILLGGAVGSRVEAALAGRLAPYLFRGVAEPSLVGPAEVAARLFVARGIPRIAGQSAATATAGATAAGVSAALVGPQPLDKNGRPRKPTLAERATFAGKAALSTVPLNLAIGAAVGTTSFALGTVKVLLRSHWDEVSGPATVNLLTEEADRRAAAAGAPLSPEEKARFGQRVEAILKAPLAAKPTGWRALAQEWNQYLKGRLPGAPGAPGGGAAEGGFGLGPAPLPLPGAPSGAAPVIGPTITLPSGAQYDLRTRPLEDLQTATQQFGQLKATGALTPEQEAHYNLLDRFVQADQAYQAQQHAAPVSPEVIEAVRHAIGTPQGYGRSGLADLDREIAALQRQGDTAFAGRLEQAKADLLSTITQTINRQMAPPGHPLIADTLPPVRASALRALSPEELARLPQSVQRILTLQDLNNSSSVLDPGAEPHFLLPVGVKNDKELRQLADNQYQLAGSHLALMFPEPAVVAPTPAPGTATPAPAVAYPRPVTLPDLQPGTVVGFPNGFVVRITGPAQPVGPSTGQAVAAQYPGIVLEQGSSPHAAGSPANLLSTNLLLGSLLDPAQYPEAQPSAPTAQPQPTTQPQPTSQPTAQPPISGTSTPDSSTGLPGNVTSAPTSGQPSPETPPSGATGVLPPSASPESTGAGTAPVATETPPTPSAPSGTTTRPVTESDLRPGTVVRSANGYEYRLERVVLQSTWETTSTFIPPGAGGVVGEKAHFLSVQLLDPSLFELVSSANQPRPLTAADLHPLTRIRNTHTGIEYRLHEKAVEGWKVMVLVVPDQRSNVKPGDRREIRTSTLLEPDRFLFIPEEEPTSAGPAAEPTAPAEPEPAPTGGVGTAAKEPEPAPPQEGPRPEPAPREAPPQPPVGRPLTPSATAPEPFYLEDIVPGLRLRDPRSGEVVRVVKTTPAPLEYSDEPVEIETLMIPHPDGIQVGDRREVDADELLYHWKRFQPLEGGFQFEEPAAPAGPRTRAVIEAELNHANDNWEALDRREKKLQETEGNDIANEAEFDLILEAKDQLEQTIRDLEAELAALDRQPEAAPSREVTQPVTEPAPQPTQPSRQPFPTTPEEKLPRPFMNLVDALLDRINQQMTADEPIFANNIQLEAFASEIMGGSRAAGTYHAQTIYNALEAAVNRYVVEQEFGKIEGGVGEALKVLQDLLKLLPTQTVRGGEKDALQQFSTPPTYALLAAYALQAKPGEDLLEPSAGTGSLLSMAESVWGSHIAGTVANEIDPERRAILRTYFTNSTYGVDARYLHSLLPHGFNFDLVIMNPPFSSAPGQRAQNTNIIGFDHVRQALSRLRPGGRLVALLGSGAAMERPTARDFWKDVQGKYTVRANIGLPAHAKDYEKYGTGFPVQVVVIDHTGPTGSQPIWTDDVGSVEAAIEGLNERGILQRQRALAPSAEPGPAEPGPTPAGGPDTERGDLGGAGPSTTGPAGGRSGGGRSGPRPAVGGGTRPGGAGAPVGGGEPQPAGGEVTPGETGPGAGPATQPVQQPEGGTAGGGQPTGHVDPDTRIPLQDYDFVRWKGGMYRGDEPKIYQVRNVDENSIDTWNVTPGGVPTGYHNTHSPVGFKFSLYDFVIRQGNEWVVVPPEEVMAARQPQPAAPPEPAPPEPAPPPAAEPTPKQPKEKRPATKPATESLEPERRIDVGTQYVTYLPLYVFEGRPHPAPMVETRSLAAVDPPPLTVTHNVKKQALYPDKQLAEEFSRLTQKPLPDPNDLGASALQLEAALYAKQRHQVILPNGQRAGFLLGDGTGGGKGRTTCLIIGDGWDSGIKRIIWFSSNATLIDAAKDDLAATGYGHIPIKLMTSFTGQEPIDPKYEGIIFSGYDTLADEAKKGTLLGKTRRQQLEDWLKAPRKEGEAATNGDNTLIIFDESHFMKNAVKVRGLPEPSKQAREGLKLQQHVPLARVVYASATAMTSLENMAYLARLGIWGEGTPWPDFAHFAGQMGGGSRYLEMVARDMKARGIYLSREISYQDPEGRPDQSVEFRPLTHEMTADDQHKYAIVAQAWQVVLANFEAALATTGSQNDAQARKRAIGQFWTTHQLFFRQFLTALKLPSLYADIDKQLDLKRSVIISLTGTGEAAEKRAVAAAAETGTSLDDLDLTPIQALVNLVNRVFPTQQYVEEYDPTTNTVTMVPMVDENGNPVENPDAIALREALLDRLAAIIDSGVKLPGNPLNEILWHYGHSNVAELTGRSDRLEPGPNGQVIRVSRGSAKTINIVEKDRFNAGEKRIAIISKSANQGISLQAGRRFKNQQRRVQYMFELNWSADQQMQANGRSHRTNQVSAPELVIVMTDAGGETRFAATIARRLASLGALTRGERGATGTGGALDQYDFENDYGIAALEATYRHILRTGSVPGLSAGRQALRDMGVLKTDRRTGLEDISSDDRRNVTRFMNRLLALEIDRQNPIFNFFADTFGDILKAAMEDPDFDRGVQDIRGENIREEGEPQLVYTDPDTGAIATYHHIVADVPLEPITLERIDKIPEADRNGWFRRDRDGVLFYVTRTQSPTHPARLVSPSSWEAARITGQQLRELYTKQELVNAQGQNDVLKARQEWEQKVSELPPTRPAHFHLVAGSILSRYDRLTSAGQRNFDVRRALLPSGQRVVGISLAPQYYRQILQALGATAGGAESTQALYERLYSTPNGPVFPLVSNLRLRLGTRSGHRVLLIEGAELDLISELGAQGYPNERDSATRRHFVWISSDPAVGVPQLQRLLQRFPPLGGGGEVAQEGAVVQKVPRLAPPVRRGLRQISPRQIPMMIPPRWTIPFETLRFLEARGDQISGAFRKMAEAAFDDTDFVRLHDFGFIIWPEVGEQRPWLAGGIHVGATGEYSETGRVYINPFPPRWNVTPGLRRGEGYEYAGLKESDDPDEVASTIATVMLHELAHLRVREEGEAILQAMDELLGNIGPEGMAALEQEIKRAITDISGKLSAEYRAARKAYFAKAGTDRRPSPTEYTADDPGTRSAFGQIVPDGGGGGNPPAGGAGGNAPRRRRGGEGHREELYTLPDPGAEAQFVGARPTQEPPLEWFKRASSEVGHFLTRVYRHLPANDPLYTEFRYKLLQLEKGWHIAHTNAVLILKQTLDDLSKADYSFFQRAVYVLDLEEEVSRQMAAATERLGARATPEQLERAIVLPQGDGSTAQAWTPKKVTAMAAEIHKQLASDQSKAVLEAMEIRRHLLDSVKDRLLEEMQKATGRTRLLDREEYFHHEILFYAEETRNQRGGGSNMQMPPPRGFMQRRIGSLLNYDSNFVSAETAWLVPAIFDTMLYELMSFVRDQFDIRKELQKLALLINDEQLMEMFEQLAEAKNQRLKSNQKPITATEIYRSRFNSTIAQGFFRLGKIAHEHPDWLPGHERWQELIEEIGTKWFLNEDAKDAGEEPIPMDEEYFRQFWQYLTWLLTPPQAGQAGSGAAALIFRGIREKRAAIKAELGGRHVTWRDLLHQTYTFNGQVVDFRDYGAFTAEPGNVLWRAWSVRDRIANSVIEAGAEGLRLDLKPEDLKKLTVLGGKKPEWVLPKVVINTLKEFRNPNRDEFDKLAARAGGAVKEWILLNPFHWWAYNLRNELTDIEVVGAANPYSFAWVKKAAPELAQFMFSREMPSDDLREWLDRGGNVATLLAANTGWRSSGTLDMLKHLRDNQTMTQKTWGRMWKSFKITTDFREAILRYASYLSYREQMRENGGVPKNFGASHEDEIMALPTIEDRAWALSNELLGAYDQVPIFFKKVRGVLPMPFLSWKVINTRRYWRLASNEFATSGGYEKLMASLLNFTALEETEQDRKKRLRDLLRLNRRLPTAGGGAGGAGGGGGGVGTGGGGGDSTGNGPFDPGEPDDEDRRRMRDAFRRLRREAKGKRNAPAWMLARMGLGPVAAFFLARFFLKVMWMNWLATAYNWAFHSDEERTMPPYARFAPHLDWGKIPGTDLYGYIDRISGIADAGGTFGVDDIMGYRDKIMSKRMTIGEMALDMAVRSPFQTFVDQVGFPRFAFELATGKQLFPKATEPRDMRDRLEYIFGAIGMGKSYLAIRGIPQRGGKMGVLYQLGGMTVFNPGESQYDEIRELAIDWKTKNKFGDPGTPGGTEKSKLAYWVKRSLKFGDQTSALHFMFMYWQAGGDEDRLALSFKYNYPLYRWPDEQKEAFLKSLTFAESRRYRNAMWFYQSHFAPTATWDKGEKERLDKAPIEEFDADMWSKIESEIDSQSPFAGYEERYPKEAAEREKLLEAVGK